MRRCICGAGSGQGVPICDLDFKILELLSIWASRPDFPCAGMVSSSLMVQHRHKATGVGPVVLYADQC